MEENENYSDKVKTLYKIIEDGVRAIRSSEEWKSYLDMAAKFYRYSFGNQMLIAQQTEGKATMVASFTRWKSLGRYIKRGEEGIKILAPVTYAQEVRDPDDETIVRLVDRIGFKIEYVFNVTQTDGEELPKRPGIDGVTGSVEAFERVRDAIISISPCNVVFEDYIGLSNGYYSPSRDEIHVQDNLENAQTISTLIHEISHAVLERSGKAAKERGAKEVEAQSISYIVGKVIAEKMGYEFDSDEYSFAYVAGWGDDTDELKSLRASLKTIQETSCELADKILDKLGLKQETVDEKSKSKGKSR